jgi:NADPH-dependent glutamate synthase beta subunit-like oxidoreductase
VCNRGQLDDPLAIRDLKRFAVDHFDLDSLEPPQIQKTEKKVAIIGAGPAGLACAHDLVVEGHEVTVFEALPEPGGMLRYAIPEYRLPKEELRKEIRYIEKLGVTIRCGVEIGKDVNLDTVRNDFDAIFIGTGAPKGLLLGVKGEDLPGVMDGLQLLRAVNSNEAVSLGKSVAVIGGGNTAIDCARTAKRLGSENVKLIYRRTRDEMPAANEEIEALLHEGIEIEFLTTPVRFYAEDGNLSRMECIRMELGEPDASGRRRPIPVEHSEFSLPVNSVITALGQATRTSFVEGIGVLLARNGTIEVDPLTGVTNIEGIFAGGDVSAGPAYVVDAIAAGQKAAKSISRYLKGEPMIAANEAKKPERLSEAEVADLTARVPRTERARMPEVSVEERVTNFGEVAIGYSPEEAGAEASRCLAGQIEGCIQCGECERLCEVKAIDQTMQDEIVEMEYDSVVRKERIRLWNAGRGYNGN